MLCPTCNMNIKDDAQFCIHCGTQFSNSPAPQGQAIQQGVQSNQPNHPGQPVQQTLPQNNTCPKCNMALQPGASFCTNCGAQLGTVQPFAQVTQTAAQKQDEREKYYQAYFNNKYHEVAQKGFSFGTFFLGCLWLMCFKLYSEAGTWFLILIGLYIVTAILVRLLAFTLIIPIIILIADIIIIIRMAVNYAKDFTSMRIAKASNEIDNILRLTDDEDERIRLCKKAGKPNYIACFIILNIILGCIGVIFSVFSSTFESIEDTRKDEFASTAEEYVSEVKTAAVADELKCGEVFSKLEPGIYYYPFTTANGDSAEKILSTGGKSPWQNKNVSGQVIILKMVKDFDPHNYVGVFYGVVLVDEDGKGVGSFDSSGHPTSVDSDSHISRIDVNASNGDYRKTFYDKTKSGSTQAFKKTAPKLSTIMNGTTLEKLMQQNGIKSVKEPVACDIVAP